MANDSGSGERASGLIHPDMSQQDKGDIKARSWIFLSRLRRIARGGYHNVSNAVLAAENRPTQILLIILLGVGVYAAWSELKDLKDLIV